MPGNNNIIDSLAIEVVGKASSAVDALDDLVAKLTGLKTKIADLGSTKATVKNIVSKEAAANLKSFADALNTLDTQKFSEFAKATQGVSRMSLGISKDSGENLRSFSDALKYVDTDRMKEFGEATQSIRSIHLGIGEKTGENLTQFAKSLETLDIGKLRELGEATKAFEGLSIRISDLERTTAKADAAQKKLSSTLKQTSKDVKKTGHSFSLAHNFVGRFFSSIKRIAFYRAIRSALRAITQGFGEGIQNLYYWSQAWGTSFAPKMDQLATAQQYLKNGFASMFSPLIEYAIPIIDRLIDKLVDLFNFVQEGFARLTGAETWNKAIKQPVKYAEALDDASGSAKELKHQLLGFDELNVLNTPTASSRGSAKEQKDYSSMFELMKTATGSPFGKFGKFFEDIYGKVEKVLGIVKSFADFLKTLNFNQLGTSLSNLWNETLSPIIDDLLDDADWFREKVLQPITKFLVEEGIPAAIDLISTALQTLWAIITPIKDGLKGFWDKNGEWIMELIGSHTLLAIEKIKEALGEIKDYFEESEAISHLFSSLSNIFEKLSPLIRVLASAAGSHAWNTFVDSIKEVIQALSPVLSLLSGIVQFIEALLTGETDFGSMAGDIGRALWDGLSFPFTMMMDAIATLLDAMAELVPEGGKAYKALKKGAAVLRGGSEDVREIGQAIEDLGTASRDGYREISDLQHAANIEMAQYVAQIRKVGPTSQDEFQTMERWASYCKEWGLDPMTGELLSDLELMKSQKQQSSVTYDSVVSDVNRAQYASKQAADLTALSWLASNTSTVSSFDKVSDKVGTLSNQDIAKLVNQIKATGITTQNEAKLIADWFRYCKNYGIDPVTGAVKQTTDAIKKTGDAMSALKDLPPKIAKAWQDTAKTFYDTGFSIGSQIKVGIQDGTRDLHLNVPATLNIVNTTGSTASTRVHGATFDMSGFASGGFPSMASLFWAGENGIPEMLGTVGGRTAVAGGAEITGIREAILQQGDQQNTLLRQLVSAVNNKDLSLVANSSTGRWVSKALKAYSGVTG